MIVIGCETPSHQGSPGWAGSFKDSQPAPQSSLSLSRGGGAGGGVGHPKVGLNADRLSGSTSESGQCDLIDVSFYSNVFDK